MHYITAANTVSTQPTAVTSGTPGWYQPGNVGTSTPSTQVDFTWLNSIQAELLNVVTSSTGGSLTPSLTTDNQLFTAITNMITNAISAMITVPTGTILSLAQATTPTGYLLCDGSAVSRTTYSNLFAAIGTTYGAGNGTTTFNLPDLRGVFIRGLDLSKGYDPSRAIGTYQVDGFGSHIHSITDPTHAHAPLAGSNFITSPGNWNGSTGSYGNYNGGTTTASASTGITINSTGISETRPKNVALYPVIKI